MAAPRAPCTAVRFVFAEEVPPPETLDVVRRQRQLLRRAAALCLDPIAEETDDQDDAPVPFSTGTGTGTSTSSCISARPRPWAATS
ncbi:hypothetical protein GUJ93_ZPchr0006g41611 [Zizania palustris]|uniref:Uncharacterized protein n=1 Tax=Zizania palustris TaxID=103762 RepID=A0A8J5SGY7_ZIZPA|nr:hypothetical protein GUJ93_ZPchr0006g41611 [Zizania palustris]